MTDPSPPPRLRKIIHIDMDAFYASVEQRDDPSLRGKPVVVAWRGPRSVVCAASYEARRFGVYSAMPALRAARLCPDAVFVPPDFTRYRSVSNQLREILLDHTDLVEPLSLDEAYLDVTANRRGFDSATEAAQAIRSEIRSVTGLTASAGVAPNKFLAKIASDWRKPDGLFVIPPTRIERFLEPLPVARIPGVGKVTQARLSRIGIETIGDLRHRTLTELCSEFGRYGQRLHELARGIDHTPVCPERPTRSISAEDTFPDDLPLDRLQPHLVRLAERVWTSAERKTLLARTVVIKLKRTDFRILTRSITPDLPPDRLDSIITLATTLLERIDPDPSTRYRLIGIGLTNLIETDAQPPRPGNLFNPD